MKMLKILLCLPMTAMATAMASEANCWKQAGERYGIDPAVLVAIAKTESSLNPLALGRNETRRGISYDVGLMQINSQWFPTLSQHGIEPTHLWDPCTSIHVGAWILANNLRRGDFWEAVGAYNAGWDPSPKQAKRRNDYAWRVYRHLAGR